MQGPGDVSRSGYRETRHVVPAGDHVAAVTLGAAKAEVPFTVKVGERTGITVPLNAGVAAFTTRPGKYIEVLAAKPYINGNRASFGYGGGPAWQKRCLRGTIW